MVFNGRRELIQYTAVENLFHELAHARHKMNGTWRYFDSEKQAIEEENVFRRPPPISPNEWQSGSRKSMEKGSTNRIGGECHTGYADAGLSHSLQSAAELLFRQLTVPYRNGRVYSVKTIGPTSRSMSHPAYIPFSVPGALIISTGILDDLSILSATLPRTHRVTPE